ncbi:MAG: methionine adenosyltransferase [Candidatus Paceibacterota bacterium]
MLTPNIFTSESVCAGHPDKICDQISDAVLDAALKVDPTSRVAVETLVTAHQTIVAGEVTTNAKLDIEKIARHEIRRLGYTKPEWNYSDQDPVLSLVHQQSPEIATGVDNDGAGDQGMMFGFACKETPELMPLPIMLAHALTAEIDRLRESKTIPYLRPDGKSQVTVRYENNQPKAVETVVVAVPHNEDIELEQVKQDLYEQLVVPMLAKYGHSVKISQLIVNGTGVWHQGGPASDTGVTGRKIIVDSYGGYARVGGGAFSGKDATKVDRSGAYAARFLAKNIVAEGLAEHAEVALAYSIGKAQPVMKNVETFDTNTVEPKVIQDFVDNLLDTSMRGIIKAFDLQRPIFRSTAAYGHFGREEFPWEKIKK